MPPTAPDLEVSFVLGRWRRRPLLYGLAAIPSAVTMAGLVFVVTSTGIDGLYPVLYPIVGMAMTMGVGLVWDRGVGEPAATWRDLDLGRSALEIPRIPRNPPELFAVAGATCWMGWAIGLLGVLAVWLGSGALTSSRLVGTVFFAFALVIPAVWAGALGPLALWGWGDVSWARSPHEEVHLEGRTLRVDGRRFLLGRDGQRIRVRDVQGGRHLVLSCDDEVLQFEGPRASIDALHHRLQSFDQSGDAAEVPAALRDIARECTADLDGDGPE